MSRSITQSLLQHRSRQTPTASKLRYRLRRRTHSSRVLSRSGTPRRWHREPAFLAEIRNWSSRNRFRMPRYRTLPPAFGMPRRRTRLGRNVRFRSVPCVSTRNASAPPRRCSMWYRVSPSTPAVFEPLLLLTWSQATVSVAGWHTRLKRSSNLLLGSFFAHWCNFVWIWSTQARASARSVRGASLFRADASRVLEEVLITGPLRHVAGFPDLRLLRDLRHVARASGDVDPARSASTEDGRVSDASHVHHVPPVGVVPSFAPAALSPAHRSSAGDLRMPIL